MSERVRRLWIATTNAGKLRDFAVAAASKVKIDPLPGLASIAAPDEDEDSFEGNARIKAIYYSKFAPREIVIADDSGLEVDALRGAPGVRSARYADDCKFALNASPPISADDRNNACLLAALLGIPAAARSGRYRCALAAARDGSILAVSEGAVEGRLLATPQGGGGFGYDPFFLPEGEVESMAELDQARRMTLSHRSRALTNLLHKLCTAGMDFTA